MNLVNICHHTFIADGLSRAATIIDCGANQGEFSSAINERWQCTIHAFEPDPNLFPKLPPLENCTYHALAIAPESGTVNLSLSVTRCSTIEYGEAGAETCEVKAVALPDFCAARGVDRIDLLKLDIEGAELDVLAALPDDWLREHVVQLTIEFHEFLDPDSLPVIERTVSRLREIGFTYLPFSRTYGDVLFVNRRYLDLSSLQRVQLGFLRYWRGLGRMVGRVFGNSR